MRPASFGSMAKTRSVPCRLLPRRDDGVEIPLDQLQRRDVHVQIPVEVLAHRWIGGRSALVGARSRNLGVPSAGEPFRPASIGAGNLPTRTVHTHDRRSME